MISQSKDQSMMIITRVTIATIKHIKRVTIISLIICTEDNILIIDKIEDLKEINLMIITDHRIDTSNKIIMNNKIDYN